MVRLLSERDPKVRAPWESGAMTDKIRPHHLERKAMLYVRQSSAHQVLQVSAKTLRLAAECGEI